MKPLRALRFLPLLTLFFSLYGTAQQSTPSAPDTPTVGVAPVVGGGEGVVVPQEGTRTEVFLGKELKIKTVYITLSKGETRMVLLEHEYGDVFDNLRDVVDGGIFRSLKDKKQVRFLAKNEGMGEVIVFDNDKPESSKQATRFVVHVSKSEFSQKLDAIRQLAGDVEGLEVKVVGNKIVLDGEILSPDEFKRVMRVYARYAADDQVEMLAEMSPLALGMIAQRIQREINDINVTVRVLNKALIMEGNVDSPQAAERYLSIAKTFLPEKVEVPASAAGIKVLRPELPSLISQMTIASGSSPQPEKMIRISVHYVELSGQYSKLFNFNWSPAISTTGSNVSFNYNNRGTSAEGTAQGLTTAFTAIIDNLLPRLQTSRGHNHARVLKSSHLLVKDKDNDGSTVTSLLNVPYQVVTSTAQGLIQSQEIAPIRNETTVKAQILPGKNAQQKDVMELSVAIQVTNLLSGAAAGQRPETSSNGVNTKIILVDGESVAIGGLMQDEQRAAYDRGRPTQRDGASPIFNLHRSRDFSQSEGQFVIFLTPQVLQNASDGTADLRRRFRLRRGVANE